MIKTASGTRQIMGKTLHKLKTYFSIKTMKAKKIVELHSQNTKWKLRNLHLVKSLQYE